ncbi:MAG: hypothetical protein LBK58_04985 [Prevotellaceae bacterium]|nr:hypothetical protein [Prevotellaceae bacterium]
MKREFINAGNKICGWYWFSTHKPCTTAEWYAPRIEFLRKWLKNLE